MDPNIPPFEGENEGGKYEGAQPTSTTNNPFDHQLVNNNEPHLIDFDQGKLCLPSVEETEEEESRFENPTHELLLYHSQ
jgi:hypothetical protein